MVQRPQHLQTGKLQDIQQEQSSSPWWWSSDLRSQRCGELRSQQGGPVQH